MFDTFGAKAVAGAASDSTDFGLDETRSPLRAARAAATTDTVPRAFARFAEKISLAGEHGPTVDDRREHVVSLLRRAFKIVDAFSTGSIPRMTGLKTRTDLDVMLVLHDRHTTGRAPSEVLQGVREVLDDQCAGVGRTARAVTLAYPTWPNVAIVPVTAPSRRDRARFGIPDLHTETWIASTPHAHTRNMDAKAAECGAAFRHLIQMIKCWNRRHGELLESFHIDALASEIFSGNLRQDYPWHLYRFFSEAVKRVAQPLDYLGTAVGSSLDADTCGEVTKRLTTARDRSRDAWHATYGTHNDHHEALRLWRIVLGEDFPA
jgi:hypothetical protein